MNENTNIYMVTMYDEAIYMYKRIHDKMTPDPISWLANQYNMRKLYELLIENNEEPILKDIFFSGRNRWTEYMKFMYISYPPGFGRAIMNEIKNNKIFDSYKIFLDLGGIKRETIKMKFL